MRVVAFDLGDTLLEYEGLPLSWEQHYSTALQLLAAGLGCAPSDVQYAAAAESLRRFNARVFPRLVEVSFAQILHELAECFALRRELDELAAARLFFRIFRQRLRCFPDTRSALSSLRSRGFKTGVFTDVPYGMPTEFVLEDVATAGLPDWIDVVITSRDAGVRKPCAGTLRRLAERLGCDAADMSYVGNERKDVEAGLAFGCKSVLIDRERVGSQWGQHCTIHSLTEL